MFLLNTNVRPEAQNEVFHAHNGLRIFIVIFMGHVHISLDPISSCLYIFQQFPYP